MAECQNFEQFGLAPNLLSAIKRMGYTKPTAIQCKAIPVVLQGRDVMGAAQTGTGKTASFGLPVLQKLLPLANTSTSPARHPVRVLILLRQESWQIKQQRHFQITQLIHPSELALFMAGWIPNLKLRH